MNPQFKFDRRPCKVLLRAFFVSPGLAMRLFCPAKAALRKAKARRCGGAPRAEMSGALVAAPGMQTRKPARDGCGISLPLGSELPPQPRLFIIDHAEVKRERHHSRIPRKQTRPGSQTPTHQQRQNSDIHGIAHKPVKSDHDQAFWRVPGRERPPP